MNSHHDVVPFTLPEVVGGSAGYGWSTPTALTRTTSRHLVSRCSYDVTGRSLLLFELVMDQGYATARRNAKAQEPTPA